MPIDLKSRLQLAKTDPEAIAWIFGSNVLAEDSYLHQRMGSDYRKYEEILLDPQVRGKLNERVGALLGRSVLVDAATPSKADEDAAAIARHIIDNHLLPYEQICSSFLLSGLVIGFAVQAVTRTVEKSYLEPILDDKGLLIKTSKKKVLLPELEFVPQRRFVFRQFEPDKVGVRVCTDEELDPHTEIAMVHGYELRLLTRRAPVEGERCPKDRFFTYTFGSLKGLPYGYGLGAMIRKFYEIRNECLKAGVLTGDRLGSPPIHGTYPDTLDKRDPEHAALIDAFNRLLRAISPNAYASTTDGFKINFLESGTTGHEVLKWLYDTSGLEIARALWGEGSYSEKETGSYSAEQQQAQNRNENIVDADCNSLDEQLGANLWDWIARYNYPKANPPIIRRETFSERRKHEEEMRAEERRSQRVTTDRMLILDLGLEVDPQYIKKTYGEAFSLPGAVPALSSLEDDEDEPPTETSNALEVPDSATEPAPEEALPEEFANFGAIIDRVLSWNGLDIGVEYLPGQVRWPGRKHSKKLRSGYGHIRRHTGVDGEALDCYLHPGLLQDPPEGSDLIFEISQLTDDGDFDKHKFMLGYASLDDARAAYLQEMSPERLGSIRAVERSELDQYANFAEPDIQDDLLDAYERRMARHLGATYQQAIAPIQALAEAIAASDASDEEKYRQFADGLYDVFEQIDPSAMQAAIADGLIAGYLAGFYSERIDDDEP